MKLKDVRIKPLNYSNFTFKLKVADKNKLDKEKQIRAFMPNLIHSLDAATLALLVKEFFDNNLNVKNIYTVHDSFGMTINNVEYIIDLLKEAIFICSI